MSLTDFSDSGEFAAEISCLSASQLCKQTGFKKGTVADVVARLAAHGIKPVAYTLGKEGGLMVGRPQFSVHHLTKINQIVREAKETKAQTIERQDKTIARLLAENAAYKAAAK